MSETLINDFTTHLEESGKSNSTVIAYKKDLEQLFEHLEVDLHKVEEAQLNQAVTALTETHGFSPKTVSRKINSFRTFYRYLNEKNKISHNPANSVAHPKFKPKKPRVLSQVEFLALREVSRGNPRLYSMIEVLLQTGIRIGEISRLKVKHYSPEQSQLQIIGFSTSESRNVPLTPKVKVVLSEFINDLESKNEEDPIFPTRDGKHIIIRNIRSSIDRAMVKAGISDACVNDIRNTFIVWQLEAGNAVDYVADVVGHKSKTTTQKYTDLLSNKYSPNGQLTIIEL